MYATPLPPGPIPLVSIPPTNPYPPLPPPYPPYPPATPTRRYATPALLGAVAYVSLNFASRQVPIPLIVQVFLSHTDPHIPHTPHPILPIYLQ